MPACTSRPPSAMNKIIRAINCSTFLPCPLCSYLRHDLSRLRSAHDPPSYHTKKRKPLSEFLTINFFLILAFFFTPSSHDFHPHLASFVMEPEDKSFTLTSLRSIFSASAVDTICFCWSLCSIQNNPQKKKMVVWFYQKRKNTWKMEGKKSGKKKRRKYQENYGYI